MQVFHRFTMATLTASLALGVGCSSSPTSTAPLPSASNQPPPTATPIASPTTSPTVTASRAPTATPTATATPTPTAAPTATSTPGFSTNFCNAQPNALPGTYAAVFSSGTLTGSTYAQASGFWYAPTFVSATPGPSPSPAPSAAPTTTPTPRAVYIYTGTYAVPTFTAAPSGSTPSQTVSATTGCVIVITTQDGKPIDSTTTTNTDGLGFPSFAQNFSTVGANLTGNITSAALTLTSTGGSGTLALDTGVMATVNLTARQASMSSSMRPLSMRPR